MKIHQDRDLVSVENRQVVAQEGEEVVGTVVLLPKADALQVAQVVQDTFTASLQRVIIQVDAN